MLTCLQNVETMSWTASSGLAAISLSDPPTKNIEVRSHRCNVNVTWHIFLEILRKHENYNIVFWQLGGSDKNLFSTPLFYDFTFTLTPSVPLPLFFLYSTDLIFFMVYPLSLPCNSAGDTTHMKSPEPLPSCAHTGRPFLYSASSVWW